MDKEESKCPCGSNKFYSECCEPFLHDKLMPKSPEELMRSRYSAFAIGNIDYIAKTMRGKANQDFDFSATQRWITKCKWYKLTVLKSSVEVSDQNLGSVEFIAEYSEKDVPHKMHEISEFKRIDGKWYYVDGKFVNENKKTVLSEKKVGRNEPCPCGSGQKYKRCCGK